MPELPDITIYVERLAAKLRGATLRRVRLLDAFVLRTALPPLDAAAALAVVGVARVGKRVVIELAGELFVVVHLMIAGRLRWLDAGVVSKAQRGLVRFEFDTGTLLLTEAGRRHRASLHLVLGRAALQTLDAGGIEVAAADFAAFDARLLAENHTLKRALTDPRLFSGIGNAYSDEILHRARLSPVALTRALTDAQRQQLHAAARAVLAEWTDHLRAESPDWPDKVTAFRPQMAVHGRYGQPCPACGAQVQRIVYAENETNYCARCQTGGKLLADRALSRLLKASWPRSIEELG